MTQSRPARRIGGIRFVHLLVLALAVALGVALSGATEVSSTVAEAATQSPPTGPRAVEHTVVVDGAARTYRSYTPSGAVSHLPLLVVLHGRGQSPDTVTGQTGFLPLVQKQRAVVVFPDGLGRSWNAGHGCCGASGQRDVPDTAFVASVVADTERSQPVDPARVYLIGYSNGGKLAYSLACSHPQLFAAMATYGAVPLETCPKATPMPALIAAGGVDTVLPIDGEAAGHPVLASMATAVHWLLQRNGCTGTPPSSTEGPALVQRWTACRAHSDVESVEYPDLGHPWPAAAVVGQAAAGATLMWTFLSPHHR
ncbi:alpha/beta hydrolase family esterase [Pseudonocardia sp. GCM10023141]|uniref:alpha/beta hydrolase family esterase n=1 Tax=Pseudonocardia sp. GCM10023141 TaxID=3252653 RepID=UPI00361BE0B9